MNVRRIIKLFILWILAWTVTCAIFAMIAFLGGTGHIPYFGVVFMLSIAGAIFGLSSGIIFMPIYFRFVSRMKSEELSLCVAVLLGIPSGFLGILPAYLLSIRVPIAVGSIAGCIGGLIFGILEIRTRRKAISAS